MRVKMQTALESHVPVIRTEEDYQAALGRLEEWIRAEDSELDSQINALGTLISQYEDTHHAVPAPDPIQAIRSRYVELGLTQNALAEQLNLESGRLSEVLSRKRTLTLTMIRRLHAVLAIPADVLIQPYETRSSTAAHVRGSMRGESESGS